MKVKERVPKNHNKPNSKTSVLRKFESFKDNSEIFPIDKMYIKKKIVL